MLVGYLMWKARECVSSSSSGSGVMYPDMEMARQVSARPSSSVPANESLWFLYEDTASIQLRSHARACLPACCCVAVTGDGRHGRHGSCRFVDEPAGRPSSASGQRPANKSKQGKGGRVLRKSRYTARREMTYGSSLGGGRIEGGGGCS